MKRMKRAASETIAAIVEILVNGTMLLFELAVKTQRWGHAIYSRGMS